MHPRVLPVLEKRREMAYEGKIDWAFGELLALGTLVAEGKLIRLSGPGHPPRHLLASGTR